MLLHLVPVLHAAAHADVVRVQSIVGVLMRERNIFLGELSRVEKERKNGDGLELRIGVCWCLREREREIYCGLQFS